MDFAFSPEQEKFRGEVQAFLEQEIPADFSCGVGGEVDEKDWPFSRSITRKLASKGWLTIPWPKEYGGQEDVIKNMILTEEFYYREAPGIDLPGTSMLAPIIMKLGSEQQKKTYLPLIATGEKVFCQGFSEPNAGSDLGSLSTRAVEGKDCFIVNGQKIWTSQAHFADYVFLLVRTNTEVPKYQGISFMLVDMKTPGVTVRPLINLANRRTFNEVFFEDVRVPLENLIGKKNDGWRVATSVLGFERSAIFRIAAARKNLARMIEFARETRQATPLIRQRLAELYIEGEVARLFAYRVAYMHSLEMPLSYEPSVSRMFGCEFSQRVANEGFHLLGLYGQLDENSKWTKLRGKILTEFLSAPGATLGGGTSEIQRNTIATRGLGLPKG